MQTDLITKVYFNEHLTHSCVGMPQGLQALSSSLIQIYMAFVAHHILNGQRMVAVINTTYLFKTGIHVFEFRIHPCDSQDNNEDLKVKGYDLIYWR